MRTADVERKTKETLIRVSLNLDGTGDCAISTGIPFLDHMVDQIGRHGRIDLAVDAQGDIEIDHHHTVEDCGIAVGEALVIALGDKKGIRRFGYAYAPLDESLSRAVIDLSGRPALVHNAEFAREQIGGIDSDLFREFFQGIVNGAKMTLHADLLRGINAHHQIESMFKAFGIALGMAVSPDSRLAGKVPSTKGRI